MQSKYFIELEGSLSEIKGDDCRAYEDAFFIWAKNSYTKEKQYKKEFLSDHLPRAILYFYTYLKDYIKDTDMVEKTIIDLLENVLRTFLEKDWPGEDINHICDDDYASSLSEFILEQLEIGEVGWKCIQEYSYYDGFVHPYKTLPGIFSLWVPDKYSDIVDAFKKALLSMPSLSMDEAMGFYLETPLSRIVSMIDFNRIMNTVFGEDWDINNAIRDRNGIRLKACMEKSVIERYRKTVSSDENIEREGFFVKSFGDTFVKYDNKYYCFRNFDPYDLDECKEYVWEEIADVRFDVPAGEEIRICDGSLIFTDHPGNGNFASFISQNHFKSERLSNKADLSKIPLYFIVNSIDICNEAIKLTGEIEVENDRADLIFSERKRQFVYKTEVKNDALGKEDFYTDEHLKKSIIQFTKACRNAIINEDEEQRDEAKRLVSVIADSYKYTDRLFVLLDEESRLKKYEDIFIVLREYLYEYFERHFLYREANRDSRNGLILYMGLYELYSDSVLDNIGYWSLLQEIDDRLFNHEKDGQFANESLWKRQGAVYASMEIEKFWYFSYRFLQRSSSEDQEAYYVTTLAPYWDHLRFATANNHLTDKAKDYISRLFRWGLANCNDLYPIVPLMTLTLTRDQLKEVTDRAFNDAVCDSCLEEADKVIKRNDDILWKELYFRLKMLNYSSSREIRDSFILLTGELNINDFYLFSLVLTLYPDIIELERESGKGDILKEFLESVASAFRFNTEIQADQAKDIFDRIQHKNSSVYTVRLLGFIKSILSTYLSEGFSLLESFASVDLISKHMVSMNQADRIGSFRIIQHNADRELIDLLGGAGNNVKGVNALCDDKEDELLNLLPAYKKALMDAYNKGYSCGKLAECYFNTCLSAYVRSDSFDSIMTEVYGDQWSIRDAIKELGGIRFAGRIDTDNSVYTKFYNPWVNQMIISAKDIHLGCSKSERPTKAFENMADEDTYHYSVYYIHDPGIRVLNDIIRFKTANGWMLDLDDAKGLYEFTISDIEMNDKGEVTVTGTID